MDMKSAKNQLGPQVYPKFIPKFFLSPKLKNWWFYSKKTYPPPKKGLFRGGGSLISCVYNPNVTWAVLHKVCMINISFCVSKHLLFFHALSFFSEDIGAFVHGLGLLQFPEILLVLKVLNWIANVQMRDWKMVTKTHTTTSFSPKDGHFFYSNNSDSITWAVFLKIVSKVFTAENFSVSFFFSFFELFLNIYANFL